MRSACVLGCLGIGWLSALPAAGDEFPYSAYVQADDVYVRSGPGRSYYPTEKLQKGAEVEVYRHDPGGWYAIRPPKDSFSWVSARYLKPTGEGLGIVSGDDVVARVGSKFSDVRDVIQIRLEPKEKVAIVGEHDGGGQTWYKIAAPAGEFRWISSSYVDRTAVADGISAPRRRPKTYFAQQQSHEEPPTVALSTADEAAPASDEVEPGWLPHDSTEPAPQPIANRVIRDIEARQAAHEEDASAVELPGDAPSEVVRFAREETRPAGDWRSERTAAMRTVAPQLDPTPTATEQDRSPTGPFEIELKAIDLEIAQMVAEEPTVWTFPELKQRLETLAGRAATAVERGEVRKLQHQIARLEDIKTRYRQLGAVLDNTDRLNSALERSGAGDAATAATTAISPITGLPMDFDAQGVLRPVVSRRQDAPRYALVDGQGEVLHFLTPAPGVNLQSMLGEPIGVFGTRGYMPDLKKPHVMVRRVEAAAMR